jgi:hypothetical protein
LQVQSHKFKFQSHQKKKKKPTKAHGEWGVIFGLWKDTG